MQIRVIGAIQRVSTLLSVLVLQATRWCSVSSTSSPRKSEDTQPAVVRSSVEDEDQGETRDRT